MNLPDQWIKTNLGNKDYFNPLNTGIDRFSGFKDYLSTSSVEGSQIVNVEEEVTFSRRPSRANLQPVPNAVWFARMRDTKKVLESSNYLCDRAILSTGFCGIYSEKVFSGYLKQFFLSNAFERQKDRLAEGTTQAALSNGKLEFIDIFFPISRPEQIKIAEILSTVDRATENTEALIAKQQRIKTGLIQDLLTRGIDEDGVIRTEDTHEFKDSQLGRIPVEWEAKHIESLLAQVDPAMRSGPFGSALLKEELVDSGIPLLGIDNVFPESFVRDYKRFVTIKKALQLKRYRVRPRDLMVTIMGTVGRCCVVPDDIGEALSSKHIWTISLDPEKYLPYLACLQINHSPWVLSHFTGDEQGGIMGAIKSDTLRSTLLPAPPISEAHEIEKIMRSISADILINQISLRKLRALKTGLMQDLLTGKVPVTPLFTKAEARA